MSMYDQGINVPINLNLSELQAKLSTTATLGTEESGRCGEMAVMGSWEGGGKGCNMTPAVLFSFLGGRWVVGGGWWVEYNMLIFQVHAYCTLQWQSNHK